MPIELRVVSIFLLTYRENSLASSHYHDLYFDLDYGVVARSWPSAASSDIRRTPCKDATGPVNISYFVSFYTEYVDSRVGVLKVLLT